MPSRIKHLCDPCFPYECVVFSPSQPPLQFYLDVIESKPWSEVSVLTYSKKDDFLNPTYTVLREMNLKGLLGSNVLFYKVSVHRLRHRTRGKTESFSGRGGRNTLEGPCSSCYFRETQEPKENLIGESVIHTSCGVCGKNELAAFLWRPIA